MDEEDMMSNIKKKEYIYIYSLANSVLRAVFKNSQLENCLLKSQTIQFQCIKYISSKVLRLITYYFRPLKNVFREFVSIFHIYIYIYIYIYENVNLYLWGIS